MNRAALLVALAALTLSPVVALGQQSVNGQWRGPVRQLKDSSATTKTFKIGRQNIALTVKLVRRPFIFDTAALAIFDQSAAVSGAVSLAPTKRGQSVSRLRVESVVITRAVGRNRELWQPAFNADPISEGTLAVPFITTEGVQAGGVTLAAPAGNSIAISGGPADWDSRSKLSGVVTVTDGTRSYRVSLGKLALKDLMPVPPDPDPIREAVIDKELMIRDLSVVESRHATESDGAWTFGRRFRGLFANDADAQAGLKRWLLTWETDQTVNGQTIAARPAIRDRIIEQWKARSGQQGIPDELWDVRWDDAPFRLLAIVNRTDLAATNPYGGPVDGAGEGRFVFGAIDAAGEPLPFTVIFEYQQAGESFFDVSSWATRWHALGERNFGDGFNNALREITDDLTTLKQLRTGEAALADTWQFREFSLGNDGLVPADAKGTPANAFNGTDLLASFINTSEEAGLSVPLTYEGVPFRAAASELPSGFVWNAPNADPLRRANMAMISCNGCHHRETGTDSVGAAGGIGAGFVHIAPRRAGEMSEISGFLEGDGNGNPLTVADPVSGESRTFNELVSRKQILEMLASSRPILLGPATGLMFDTSAADIREAAIRTMQLGRRGRVH